jgi:hypothetical protein
MAKKKDFYELIDGNDLEKKLKSAYEQEREELLRKSKPLQDLLFIEHFYVPNSTIQESYNTSFTPTSELIIGGNNTQYNAGLLFKTIIDVEPQYDDIPIKKLHFCSSSIVKKGDYISALIPRFTEKKMGYLKYNPNIKEVFYFDRLYNEIEHPIELLIHSNDKQKDVIKKERSPNYYNYFLKK